MKEKPFEYIESVIKAAAENNQPSPDEQNWQRMEQLLDKEDKKRRGFIWFLFPALVLLLGGGYFIFTGKATRNRIEIPAGQPLTDKTKDWQPAGLPHQSQDIKSGTAPLMATNKTATSIAPVIVKDEPANNTTVSHSLKSSKKIRAATINKTSIHQVSGEEKHHEPGKFIKTTNGSMNSQVSSDIEKNEDSYQQVAFTALKKDHTNALAEQLKKEEQPKDTTPAKTVNGTDKKKAGKTVRPRFYVLASIGADQNSLHFLSFKNMAIGAKYNLGIGYRFSKKMSIQTGINISRKKYVAGPGDYTFKAGSYLAYLDIKKVDANCLIYELPLAVRYMIVEKPAVIFFVTTGLSSLIMKKEEYNYFYYYNNIPYARAYTYTGNQHLFSFWTFSAGIEKKVSSSLYLTAEPNLGIPLNGVGEGSVKLHTFGIQLGARYNFGKQK